MELLEYKGDDLEEVFMQTFRVGYQDVFGTSLTHDLKTDGDNILVSQSSKHVSGGYLLQCSAGTHFLARMVRVIPFLAGTVIFFSEVRLISLL